MTEGMLRALFGLISAIAVAMFAMPTVAQATLTVYADPITWTYQTGFTGDTNGGQEAWQAQVGSAAQPFTGTSVRTDLNWQCVTQSCGGQPLAFFSTTTVSQGLDPFTIRFTATPNSGSCANSQLGFPGCGGTRSSTFLLSTPIYAFGAMVTVSGDGHHVTLFDGIQIENYPQNIFANIMPTSATLFFGVISDTAFSSFVISSDLAISDDAFREAFGDILVSTTAIDEPPTIAIFGAALGLLGLTRPFRGRQHRRNRRSGTTRGLVSA